MEQGGGPPIGYALLNLGFVSFALGAVGIFKQMPNIGLPTRNRAYVWVGFGALLMTIGLILMVFVEGGFA